MTSDRHLALMALMREVTTPARTFDRCVSRAAGLPTGSPRHDKAVALGNSALDDIEQAVRRWVAAHPDPDTAVPLPPAAPTPGQCAHESWDVTGEHRTEAGWHKTRRCDDCGADLAPVVEAEPHWDLQPGGPVVPFANADQTAVRGQLLHALDFAACQTLGYATPEALLAAYDTSRAPADQAAEIERLRTEHATWRKHGRRNLQVAHEGNARLRAELHRAEAEVKRLHADRAAVLREAYEIAFAEGKRLNALEAEIGVGPYRGALAVAHLLRKAISDAQQVGRMADETAGTETEPKCAQCGHSRGRHMGDTHERGCHVCWDSPSNSGWNHRFQDAEQPAASTRQDGAQP